MTARRKQYVTIKGIKDGLVFYLNDHCNYELLLRELNYILEKTHEQFFTGPIIHVHVKLGRRHITEFQKDQIRDIIKQKGNLLIQSIESDADHEPAQAPSRLKQIKGIVRSGQVLEHKGDLLFLGDVNPGGSIVSTGSIYILGALRGMAHAGSEGDETAIIAASYLSPMQLKIAEVLSRAPDDDSVSKGYMEFAYIKEGVMEIDTMNHLHQLLPSD